MIKSRVRWPEYVHVVRVGERRTIYKVMDGKPEDMRPFIRPSRRWEDNIKMDLREIGCKGVEWIHQDQVGTGDGLLLTR
jgi:hypothetical protein